MVVLRGAEEASEPMKRRLLREIDTPQLCAECGLPISATSDTGSGTRRAAARCACKVNPPHADQAGCPPSLAKALIAVVAFGVLSACTAQQARRIAFHDFGLCQSHACGEFERRYLDVVQCMGVIA